MSSGKATLFLGDLSTFCTELDIHNLFLPFGEITEIKIMRSEETYRNLSYGFIKFAHPASAKRAMSALNGVLFCGRHLRIGWASYKSKKEPKLFHHDRIESSSVHISFISYQLKNLITEESLRQLFSNYGVVLDTSIKKCYIDQSINRQCGYGFVHYASSQEGIESALAAVAGLNDATIENVCYKCSISHNLEKYLLDTQAQSQRQEQQPFGQNFDPYRLTASPTCSEQADYSPYGSIASNRGHMEVKDTSDPYRMSFRRPNQMMSMQLNSGLTSVHSSVDFRSRPSSGSHASEYSYQSEQSGENPDHFLQSIDENLMRSFRNKLHVGTPGLGNGSNYNSGANTGDNTPTQQYLLQKFQHHPHMNSQMHAQSKLPNTLIHGANQLPHHGSGSGSGTNSPLTCSGSPPFNHNLSGNSSVFSALKNEQSLPLPPKQSTSMHSNNLSLLHPSGANNGDYQLSSTFDQLNINYNQLSGHQNGGYSFALTEQTNQGIDNLNAGFTKLGLDGNALTSPIPAGMPTKTFYDNLLKLSTDEQERNHYFAHASVPFHQSLNVNYDHTSEASVNNTSVNKRYNINNLNQSLLRPGNNLSDQTSNYHDPRSVTENEIINSNALNNYFSQDTRLRHELY